MSAVKDQARSLGDLIADVGALVALVDDAATAGDCAALREDVLALIPAVQGVTGGKTRAGSRLGEAAIHLARAGVHLPHERGCLLASLALGSALAELEMFNAAAVLGGGPS